jgi:DNA-binding IclR family transcriptional regulator
MRRLASSSRRAIHLGVFEAEMVTYLFKESQSEQVLTRETMQLEAYCSAICKVLLAGLGDDRLNEYLRAAPFVRLTDRTLTDPDELRIHLDQVRCYERAVDNREIDEDLWCVAVPIRREDGQVVAALSSSGPCLYPAARIDGPLTALRKIAMEVHMRLFSSRPTGWSLPRSIAKFPSSDMPATDSFAVFLELRKRIRRSDFLN